MSQSPRALADLLPCPFCWRPPASNSDCGYAKKIAHMVWCETKNCAMDQRYTTVESWNRRAQAPAQPDKMLPVGTRIQFTKELSATATGDHPALLYARKGEMGTITGHGTSEGYWARTDRWEAPFGASASEFEIAAAPSAGKNEPAPEAAPTLTGCACRWDADDNRIATCARHQGWLDVVHEWAERAKAAEALLARPAAQDAVMEIANLKLANEEARKTIDRLCAELNRLRPNPVNGGAVGRTQGVKE